MYKMTLHPKFLQNWMDVFLI